MKFLVILIFAIAPATLFAETCENIFEIEKINYPIPFERLSMLTIPLGTAADRMVEVSAERHRVAGHLHTFQRVLPEIKNLPLRGFKKYRERIQRSPAWFRLFGFEIRDDETIAIPDLAYVTSEVQRMQKEGFRLAPSLIPATYSGSDVLSPTDGIRMLAEGQFIVSTGSDYWWQHDLLNHGMTGYLLIPAKVTAELKAHAILLIETLNNSKNAKLRKLAQAEAANLMAFMDSFSEGIFGSLSHGTKAELSEHINQYLDEIDQMRRNFLASAFKTTYSKKAKIDFKNRLGSLKSLTIEERTVVVENIFDAFSGNF